MTEPAEPPSSVPEPTDTTTSVELPSSSPGSASAMPTSPTTGGDTSSRAEPTQTQSVDGKTVTVIGDSVTIAATPELEKMMPGVYVDAAVSRSSRVAAGILAKLEDEGELRDTVVIALATNGTITEADTEAILKVVGKDRTLVYVTGFGPARTSWIPMANSEIERAAKKYPNVVVADWHAAVKDRTDLLAGDVVHPKTEGAHLYSQVIADACQKY